MTRIHAKQALTPQGWVRDLRLTLTPEGRIAQVETGHPHPAAHDLLLPAPTNLHSHAFQRAMAGLTEARGPDPSDSFWTWRRLMYRFLDQLTPDQIEAITALVFMEMLEAGFASVAEFHYLHHGVGGTPYADPAELSSRITAAAARTGIGLTLLPVLYETGGCDGRALQGGQRRFGNTPDSYADLHAAAARLIAKGPADHHIGAAPHSLRAVTREGLSRAIALAGPAPLHMHLAEQVAEVEEVQAHLGARPTDWLLAHYDVAPNWCLIHCTQMTSAETQALAATGAVAGLCPITESSLGDGIFNATDYLSAKGRIGIGSDSNIQISLFDELRTLEYSQRLRDRTRAALASPDRSTGRTLIEAALQGGAQAAGRDSGALRPGAWADLIAIETDNHRLCKRQGDTLLDTLIFTGQGAQCISDVWSAGRHVVQDHRHIARDAITTAFRATLSELNQSL
ncbi:formimidoylglutamate deiminase [Pseudooceanicola spongiae]|uniref:Formimidoylglutamate deiminase n=1 Tax=Pseudooceanicola spongiae TaxID=2613965 RepID=A0A7L9WQY2_9RHOB|nr:formimidoylglutamate deiminase [Pseudooceanicola spongiae]QOL82117.1 formimidoylglutamate deiminase [Pseudooceanicola spongiae]